MALLLKHSGSTQKQSLSSHYTVGNCYIVCRNFLQIITVIIEKFNYCKGTLHSNLLCNISITLFYRIMITLYFLRCKEVDVCRNFPQIITVIIEKFNYCKGTLHSNLLCNISITLFYRIMITLYFLRCKEVIVYITNT